MTQRRTLFCAACAAGVALVAAALTAIAPCSPAEPAPKPSAAGKEKADEADLIELKIDLPRATFVGTPPNLRAFRKKNKLRPSTIDRKVLVPKGLRLKNVAAGRPVTASDPEPTTGELSYVTDGDKEAVDGCFVELSHGLQWVQVDLARPHDIRVIVLWHYHAQARVYRDVVVQVANDRDFIEGVRTLFNNDHDNSAGLGIGKDLQYVDDHRGEVIQPAKRVRARYVRLYSNGNTMDELNHYTEVEVYAASADGAAASRPAGADR